jgi:2-polyprenyl-3-methyl-5-hydroxy-6-metoxy-1,4-benzoquinol methylase
MSTQEMSLFTRTRAWAANSPTVRGWRTRRYERFVELCGVSPSDRILDVGAGRGAALERFNDTNEIVAVDLRPPSGPYMEQANVSIQVADGTQLPYADKSFPVAFSNSVIEHVPKDRQAMFAAEIQRVAERYFVQTPNRWFPIEPHYQLPLFQFLPLRVRRALNARFSLGWQERGQWEEITLLSVRDLRRLFPDAVIHRERVFGLTKSLMAVRGPA